MTLYSANVLDFAKPVPSKKRPVLDTVPEEEVKEKKPRTEKQIAAFAKAKETRERKKAEAHAAKEAEAKQAADAVEKETKSNAEKQAKTNAAKEKRRLKKQGKQEETPTSSVDGADPSLDEAVDKAVEEVTTRPSPPPVKKRQVKAFVKTNDEEPPAWFHKYVEGVKNAESTLAREKKPKRQIKEEAKVAAKEHWDDGLTRNRVENEVDGHMSRMYNMMFSGRRLR